MRKNLIADDFPCVFTNTDPEKVWVFHETRDGKNMVGYSLKKAVSKSLIMVEENVSFGGEYWRLKLAPRNSRVRITLT
jgi:hypothetical protein